VGSAIVFSCSVESCNCQVAFVSLPDAEDAAQRADYVQLKSGNALPGRAFEHEVTRVRTH